MFDNNKWSHRTAKRHIMTGKRVNGFALPTVLIASVAMMIILLASLATLSSVAQAINSQYYQQLAEEAAESGITRANDCLSHNTYVAQWSAASQLRPGTACTGGSQCTNTSTCYVLYTSTTRSTFSVSAVTTQASSQTVNVTGTVQLLSASSGSVIQTYNTTTSARVGINQSVSNVFFGYNGDSGAYFLTLAGNGSLLGVGYNGNGQLGTGSTANTLTPVPVIVPGGKSISSVFTNFVSNGSDTFFTTRDGLLYGMGANGWGQLGIGYANTLVASATQITLPYGRIARTVYSLGGATFVTTTDGYVYSMGLCQGGVLGTGYAVASCSNSSSPQQVLLPTPTSGQPNTYPSDVITGDYINMYVIMQGGAVYGWGTNNNGEQATGNTTSQSTPIRLGTFGNSGQPKAVQVVSDGASVWILDSNGTVWGAGANGNGQLGDGTNTNRTTLVKSLFPAEAGQIVKIATDQWTLVALSANGTVWGVGLNNFGQLGNGATSDTNTPVQFDLPNGVQATDIWNTSHLSTPNVVDTYAIGDDGKVYGAGSNTYGQLGDGTTTNRSTPVAMSVIDGSSIVADQVYAGNGTTVVHTTNGKVYTVGNNASGQLGDGTTTNSSTPKANVYTNVLPVVIY